MTTANTVLHRREGAVVTLSLNRPERRNALGLELRAELLGGLEAAMEDPACRAVVLTGEGGHFCSGGDISAMDGLTAIDGVRRLEAAHRLVRLLVEGPKPVIAAVEGHAAGAGMSLAAACDIVVAARDATFTCSFTRIGLVADFGAAYTLPMRVGAGRARQIMLTGEPVPAETAERWGLVEVLAGPGEARSAAAALAARIASGTSPLSSTFAKRLLGRMPGSLDEVLKAEAEAQGILFTTADFAEGRAAFREKRKPVFEGR